MALDIILWLGLLVVLGLLFAITLHRMSGLVARTHALERFQAAVDSLDRRLSERVAPLVQALEETRRHPGDPAGLVDQLRAAQSVIDGLRAECHAIAAPPGIAGIRAALAEDLDRAARAAAHVGQGLGAIGRADVGPDPETQTAVKRGTLELRHAQEAFALRAREVARLRPADLTPGALRAALAAPPMVASGVDGDDSDGRSDPLM